MRMRNSFQPNLCSAWMYFPSYMQLRESRIAAFDRPLASKLRVSPRRIRSLHAAEADSLPVQPVLG
jgi:hypothetical protein